MNFLEVEKYLQSLGEKERDQIRVQLTNPSATVEHRANALREINQIQLFIQGFCFAIELLDSPAQGKYYKEFFDQARSKNGLKGGSP
jgi:hypothetical protein